jgi:hypothetical protein
MRASLTFSGLAVADRETLMADVPARAIALDMTAPLLIDC